MSGEMLNEREAPECKGMSEAGVGVAWLSMMGYVLQ